MATNFVQIESDSEIKQRLEAERVRLRRIAGLDKPTHFHRPVERGLPRHLSNHRLGEMRSLVAEEMFAWSGQR